MRRKTTIITCALAAVAFIIFSLATGGLAYSSRKDFFGQAKIVVAGGPQGNVSLEPRRTRFDIPLLAHYYGTRMPCGLSLIIWDESKTYASVTITEIVVDYSDGQTVRHTQPWSRNLTPYTQTNHTRARGVYKTEMMRLRETIPDVVKRHTDARVTVTGKLIKNDGTAIDFSTMANFKATSDSDLTTYWQVLSKF